MKDEIIKFGRKAVEQGLVSSHFGNISVRIGDKMLITRSGSMLDELEEKDIVEVYIDRETSLDLIASSESLAHRMIYKKTSALAIMHVHSPYCVIESILLNKKGQDRLVPVDSEGGYFLHDIPIVTGGVGTEEMARNLATALSERKVAIVLGHGTFAIGKILEEAFVNAAMAEHCAMVKYHTDLMLR